MTCMLTGEYRREPNSDVRQFVETFEVESENEVVRAASHIIRKNGGMQRLRHAQVRDLDGKPIFFVR